MKNRVLLALSALVFLSSCTEEEFGTIAAPTTFKVNTKYDDTFKNLNASKVTITLTSINTSEKYEMLTNEAGEAVFQNIIPGVYDINAAITMSAAEFKKSFGYSPETNEVIFNATLSQTLINSENTSKDIVLKTARLGNLVIKQIYYGGSNTKTGASFRDQFIEIYNNSNEVIYADGLYFGQVLGVLNSTTTEYTQPNGQYDWSRSIGMTSGEAANTDYVYCDNIYQIPGNGNQYPIQPGESIVIAQSALNHKAPLVGNDGKPLEVQDPTQTIDLSNADFEVNFSEFRKTLNEEPFKSDIENPAVPNMLIAYVGKAPKYNVYTDMLFDNLGRDSYVIFRAESFNFNEFPLPNVLSITDKTTFYAQIPTNIILDGVETQHASSPIPRRLPESLDTSYTKINAAYTTESVIRKVKQTVDGRKILQDSNNSANDFVVIKANPKGFVE